VLLGLLEFILDRSNILLGIPHGTRDFQNIRSVLGDVHTILLRNIREAHDDVLELVLIETSEINQTPIGAALPGDEVTFVLEPFTWGLIIDLDFLSGGVLNDGGIQDSASQPGHFSGDVDAKLGGVRIVLVHGVVLHQSVKDLLLSLLGFDGGGSDHLGDGVIRKLLLDGHWLLLHAAKLHRDEDSLLLGSDPDTRHIGILQDDLVGF